MAYKLVKTFPRLWSLEAGKAMVVTDLHGDWDAYRRYRDRFVDLRAAEAIDCLVFTGDLIHSQSSARRDRSLDIVVDVMDLKERYGEAVVCLCGNHELVHVYGINLAKGSQEYTPAFEALLTATGRRDEVMRLFDALPFYVRTRAGVTLAHAGASAAVSEAEKAVHLFNWSHRGLLDAAERVLQGDGVAALRRAYARLNRAPSYDFLARHYLAVDGRVDPRYDHLLRGFLAASSPSFDLLWSALFTRCEEEYGPADYAIFLDAMLKELSLDFFPQYVLISGHMKTPGGYRIVAGRQLRLASAAHARPREAGRYLVFDAARPVSTVNDLLSGLHSVY